MKTSVSVLSLLFVGLACSTQPPLETEDAGLVQEPDAGALPDHDAGDDPPLPDAGASDEHDAGGVVTAPAFAYPPLQTSLPEYFLEIDEAVLDEIYADLYSDVERPAVFESEGQRHEVGVRLRGSSSRKWPKKSWRIEFPEGTKWDGRRKHNLVAEYQDATLMAEKFAYDSLLAMGAPAPRTRFVKLTINGRYQGVFVDIERVDKDFLKAHRFDDRDGNIYRCGGKDCEMKLWRTAYQKRFTKETNETEPSDDLDAFLLMVNRTQEPELVDAFERHLELDDLLKSMAMEALASNGIQTDSGSYLVHDRLTDRWTYVAWDLNNADSTFWHGYPRTQQPFPTRTVPGYSLLDNGIEKLYLKRLGDEPDYLPAFSNLNTRIAFHPRLRERFCATLEKALDDLFAPEVGPARIDAMYALIAPHMEDDPYVDLSKFREGPRYLKTYIAQREQFLRRQVEALREWPLGLVLETVDPHEDVVELRNRGPLAVSLGGLALTSNLRRALDANLPDVSVAPGTTVRFDASDVGVDLDTTGGEIGLFDGRSVAGAMDVLFYGPLATGERLTRSSKDPRDWRVE